MEEKNIVDEKAIKKHFSALLFKVAIGIVFTIVLQLITGIICGNFFPEVLNNPTLSLLVSMGPLYVIGYPLCYLVVRTTPVSETIPQKKMKVWQILFGAIMAFGMMYFANIFGTVLVNIISLILNRPIGNVLASAATAGSNIIVFSVIMAICAPVSEELIFRKLIIDRTIAYGEWISILLSATIFALFHGNVAQMVYAFPIGLFFGFIYVRTGRIRYTMILHIILNTLGTVFPTIMLKFIDITELTTIVASGDVQKVLEYEMGHIPGLLMLVFQELLVFGSIIAAIALFIVALVKKKFFLVKRDTDIPKGRRFKLVFLNVGMLIIVLAMGALTIYQLVAM